VGHARGTPLNLSRPVADGVGRQRHRVRVGGPEPDIDHPNNGISDRALVLKYEWLSARRFFGREQRFGRSFGRAEAALDDRVVGFGEVESCAIDFLVGP
jgi:hypothetical protein